MPALFFPDLAGWLFANMGAAPILVLSRRCAVKSAVLRGLVLVSLLLAGGAVFALPARAQSGPGVPSLTYPQNELFEAISTIGAGNHGTPMMHDGYLTVVESDPSPGVRFYDISNPYTPVLVQSISGAGADLPEQHTYAQTTAWGGNHVVIARGWGPIAAGGGTGLAIWDWSDIQNPLLRASWDIPGLPGGYLTGLFWLAVQAPYVYCPAGSLGLYIVDASDPTSPVVVAQIPKSQTGGFNVVNAFAVGTMLIVTNNDGGTGVGPGIARLDISDPVNPQLLASTTNTTSPYGAAVNGGKLLVPGVDGTLAFHDLDSPSFDVVGSFFVGGTRGASVMLQDEFVHVGGTRAYYKMDVSNPGGFFPVGAYSLGILPRDEDWVTPVGNLVALADDAGNGTHLIPHAAAPDNTGPAVNMVVPADGAIDQALTARVGITLTDMVELASIGPTTFAVRPVGGVALPGVYTNQFGVVNFSPDQPLAPNTTYEVVVPAGGLTDWAGNPTAIGFSSTFSTGSQVHAIDVDAQSPTPTELGQQSAFDVASVSGAGPFTYSWNFGDGTPSTAPSGASQATHTYAEAGHYPVRVTVSNGSITAVDAFVQTVHHPLTAATPSRASTLALDEGEGLVWCVNADNDTVTAVDTQTIRGVYEVPVGDRPRTLAVAPDGSLWVVCDGDARIDVIDQSVGQNVESIALPYASRPYGIAMRPDGLSAYVTLRATGEVAEIDVASRALARVTAVGPDPRGLAIAADSERIFVTRFVSESRRAAPEQPSGTPSLSSGRGAAERHWRSGRDVRDREGAPFAEIYELSATSFSVVRTLRLALDDGPDTEAGGRGLPNYLGSPTVSPDGGRLWVPSKKDNILRGLRRDGLPLTHENTVRTIVSQIDLTTGVEIGASRLDFNDRDLAFAVEMSPLGDYAFHALQGSNAVAVTDAYSGVLAAGVDGTGLAPQGLALTSDGSALFVHNFMSRSIAAYDVQGVTDSTSFAMPLLGTWTTVSNEQLAPDVLRGKQIFYNATDPRMNQDGYISCASCHLDGEQDGRVWDFSDRGEGLRNTISLLGRRGTGHGNVHWTANFDEIQDFEHDMRGPFGGDGFLSDAQWNSGTVSQPLGTPKAGLSSDLDALAAYVSSLASVGLSPHRNSDGTLTADAVAGKALFASLQCGQCHSGPDYTDSSSGVLHDVGTLRRRSGEASGAALVGLDTPTLRGLWATAPYLHDGSARTLMDVLTTRNPNGQHGATASLSREQRRQLAAYLLQIDDLEP